MTARRGLAIVLVCLLGALLGAVVGGLLLYSAAPGPGEGGDKFGANVVLAGLGGVVLGGLGGGVLGGVLGNLLGRQLEKPPDEGPGRPGE
jgi:hypothetical protein